MKFNPPHKEVIVLLGKPASGKGTQAEPIAREIGIPYVSIGKLLRTEVKKKTKIGKVAAKYLSSGKLVPYKISVALIKRRLMRPDAKKGVILDGFPRQAEQARELEKIVHVTHAVLISVTDKEVLHRITGRRTCPKCGRVYHLIACPPKKKGICDHCGSVLVHRNDDKAGVVAERLKSYHEDTIPVLHFYRRRRALRRVDGLGTISDVRRRALAAIERSDKGLKLKH